MNDVKVHYNSLKPAPLRAAAYTLGTEIHLGPGQERHLPHEAWHVVQQKQGRVAPTGRMGGQAVNINAVLEREADLMGQKALQSSAVQAAEVHPSSVTVQPQMTPAIQMKTGFEVELDVPAYIEPPANRRPTLMPSEELTTAEERDIQAFLAGGLEYSYVYGAHPRGYFHLTADHSGFQTPHFELIDALVEKKLVHKFFHRPMSNLEYVTPPFEEISHLALQDVADAIQDHAGATATAAKQGQKSAIGAPARGLFTGVPVSALNKLVGNDVDLRAKVGQLTNKIKATTYLQESIGALPSEMFNLFKKGASDILNTTRTQLALRKAGLSEDQIDQLKESDTKTIGFGALAKIYKTRYVNMMVLLKSVSLAEAVRLKEDTPGEFIEPIRGYLALVGQYLIASHLDQHAGYIGQTTPKNRVPYLSRIALYQARDALPPKATHHLSASWQQARGDFFGAAGKKAGEIITGANLEKDAKESSSDRTVFGLQDAEEAVDRIVQGEETYAVSTGSLIGLDETEDVKVPGEKLIVLEDRSLDMKLLEKEKRPENIAATIMKRWRRANYNRLVTVGKESYNGRVKDLGDGLIKIRLMQNALEVGFNKMLADKAKEMKDLVAIAEPILRDPTSLDAVLAAKLEKTFDGITKFQGRVATITKGRVAAKEKIAPVVNAFFVRFFTTFVEAAVGEAIMAQDSEERRTAQHEIVKISEFFEGESRSAGHFEPKIEELKFKGEDRHVAHGPSGILLIQDVFGLGAVQGTDGSPFPVLKYEDGVELWLVYSSLATGERSWLPPTEMRKKMEAKEKKRERQEVEEEPRQEAGKPVVPAINAGVHQRPAVPAEPTARNRRRRGRNQGVRLRPSLGFLRIGASSWFRSRPTSG